jgi:CO/xanthine dehydrogenase FAD-binding subunit
MPDPELRLEEPINLSGVIALLAANLGKARLIAGGTDIVVDMKNFDVNPEMLVSLARLPKLKAIEEIDGELVIGALVTPNLIAESRLVQERLPALSEAARSMGSYQIRNLATIGGNLCSASPSADLPPTLIAAGAEIIIQGESGEHRKSLGQFFLDARKTSLGDAEVLTYIVIPQQPPHSGTSYLPFKLRQANALAVASSAVRLTLDKKGKIKDAIVVLGAVAPVPMVAEKSSRLLIGKEPCVELFEEAALQASEESKPISDVRGSAAHRKSLVTVLTRRALSEAHSRAQRDGAA